MEKPKEPKENPYEGIYGETEIEFGQDGKVKKITERKSGRDVTPTEKEEPPESAYWRLNEFGRRRVNAELKKFVESREASLSPAEFNEALDKKREELAKRILEL